MTDRRLYDYIISFIVLGDNNERFIIDLSKEYGWGKHFSNMVYKEYLKFIYLCAINEKPLSPPILIDKVWKFHMGYSESYWHKLCEIILKKPLHRGFPSNINIGIEKEFFRDTKLKYFEEFKEKPPKLIWGVDNNKYVNNLIQNSIFLLTRWKCIFLTSLISVWIVIYILKGN